MDKKILGAILPGNSTVELREFDMPKPGHGQVVVKTKASTICGSDIRCIYRAHVGKGPEGYQPGMIAGHEPCGIIVEEGEGLKRFKKGDRVIVYHISGCGVCYDCRRGYYIACKSKYRAAYGWQRNGGMAPYMLCDEKDLIALPDELSYEDASGTLAVGAARGGMAVDWPLDIRLIRRDGTWNITRARYRGQATELTLNESN